MSALKLRQTSHRGSVLASGFVIDTALIPEATARARMLRLASVGLSVFRAGTCLIASFRDSVRVDVATAPGAPLVRQGRLLSAAPLDADELEQLESPLEAIVLSRGGRALLLHLDELLPEDISCWLDWSAFAVIEGLQPLGEVAPAPRTVAVDEKADVRLALGVTPLTADAQQVIETLARGGPDSQGSGASSFFTALGGLWSDLWQALRGAGQRLRASQRGASAHELALPPVSPVAVSWLSRLGDGLRQLATRALLWSRLAPLLGRRQAEYLARTLAMFDANQLDEALRHAIPLTGSLRDALAPPMLGLPSPRSELAIVPGRAGASSVMGLGGALFEELRRRYRRAFERLVALGDVEKAAFVLAELLGDDAEAVSFLERQGRPELAAQIAEARNLPAGLVIRLWFLAGDKARAIRIARRTGEFGDAVLRLEKSHPLQARALRLHWADYLAGTGAYAAAVDTLWPVAVARELALSWLDRAIAIGGPTGARMLARKAHALAASFPEARAAVLGWAQDEPAERGLLQALGLELTRAPPTPETRALARVAARRLLPYTQDRSIDRLVQSLLDICGDTVLRADVRAGRSPGAGAVLRERAARDEVPTIPDGRLGPPPIQRLRADRGALRVLDAAELPDGRLLVALGELGVWLLSAQGKVLTRFAEPASQLVISDHGDRAILLAPRGGAYRVARLDLISKRVRPWCDARFDRFAPDFDGSTWFVAQGDSVYAIDATSEDWEQLWKLENPGAFAFSLRRDEKSVCVWFLAPDNKSELWTFEQPSLTLRRRRQRIEDEGAELHMATSARGKFAGWRVHRAGEAVACTLAGDHWTPLPLSPSARPEAVWVTDEWFAFAASSEAGLRIQVLDAASHVEKARLEFEGAPQVGLRFQADHLTVFDSDGRVLVISLINGAVLREYRIA